MDFIKTETLYVSKDIIKKVRDTRNQAWIKGQPRCPQAQEGCILTTLSHVHVGHRPLQPLRGGGNLPVVLAAVSCCLQRWTGRELHVSVHLRCSAPLETDSTVTGNVVLAYVLFFNLMRNEQPATSLHPLSALSLWTLIFNSLSECKVGSGARLLCIFTSLFGPQFPHLWNGTNNRKLHYGAAPGTKSANPRKDHSTPRALDKRRVSANGTTPHCSYFWSLPGNIKCPSSLSLNSRDLLNSHPLIQHSSRSHEVVRQVMEQNSA